MFLFELMARDFLRETRPELADALLFAVVVSLLITIAVVIWIYISMQRPAVKTAMLLLELRCFLRFMEFT